MNLLQKDLNSIRYTCKTKKCKYFGWIAWIPFKNLVPVCSECGKVNIEIKEDTC